MSAIRLQVFLARAGIGSRRACEELIRAGSVTINGQRAELGAKVEPGEDHVKVRGRRVGGAERPRVVALHVPRGVVTTASDPEGRTTVLDLVPSSQRLHTVGRLDLQTSGLLLLTNDGELTQLLTHPSSGVARTYEAKVRGRPDERTLTRLAAGVVIDGQRTEPLAVRPLRGSENAAWLEVVVHEGRKHLVRNALAAVGHPVVKLHRTAFGPLRLGALPAGAWRDLQPGEVEELRRAARRSAARGGARAEAQRSAEAQRAETSKRARKTKRAESSKRAGTAKRPGTGAGSKTASRPERTARPERSERPTRRPERPGSRKTSSRTSARKTGSRGGAGGSEKGRGATPRGPRRT